jgi:hypothetical protein
MIDFKKLNDDVVALKARVVHFRHLQQVAEESLYQANRDLTEARAAQASAEALLAAEVALSQYNQGVIEIARFAYTRVRDVQRLRESGRLMQSRWVLETAIKYASLAYPKDHPEYRLLRAAMDILREDHSAKSTDVITKGLALEKELREALTISSFTQ